MPSLMPPLVPTRLRVIDGDRTCLLGVPVTSCRTGIREACVRVGIVYSRAQNGAVEFNPLIANTFLALTNLRADPAGPFSLMEFSVLDS